MTPNDYDRFCEIVVGFAALKGRTLPVEAIKLFWSSMQHWNLEDFQQAAYHLVHSCQFMPTPKDFEDLRKAGRPTAGEAWTKALNIARTTWNAQSCGDTDIDRAVHAIGGYNAISMSDVDKTQFLERRFCEHFETAQDAQDVREELPQIALNLRTLTKQISQQKKVTK